MWKNAVEDPDLCKDTDYLSGRFSEARIPLGVVCAPVISPHDCHVLDRFLVVQS